MPLDSYDTAVNVLGGLRDAETLSGALKDFFRKLDEDDSARHGLTKSHRTEETKRRVERVIQSVVIRFRSDDHRELLRSFYRSDAPTRDREVVLFWHLAMNNRLFREISVKVFAKAYFAGRAGLKKDDILGYLKEFLIHDESLGLGWAESTIDRLATKYLNLMTKLNLLAGSRSKSFVPVRLSSEAVTLFLYLARVHEPETRNILKTNCCRSVSFHQTSWLIG